MPVDVDFARLRPWGQGQATAFEELCCQIARAQAASRGHRFVRLGTPDGGVEAYEIDGNGGEHGIQAKFFLAKPTPGQWADITQSIKRAVGTHPQLVKLTIALPVDRADPRIENQAWFMDEWNDKTAEWETYARENGRNITFSYMGKSEVADALSREEHAGRYRWWFDRQLLSDSWLNDRLEEAISQVGPRYNRDLTVEVPAGRRLVQFSRAPSLLVELDRLAITAYQHAATIAAALPSGQPAEILDAAAGLPRPISGADPVPAANVTPPFTDWLEAWKGVGRAAPRGDEVPGEDAHGNRTSVGAAFDGLSDAVERATSLLYEDARAYQARAMLLWGDAGAGKTHLLCDTAVQALNRGAPVVMILGQQLGTGQPWNEILRVLQFQGSADEFLQALSARAEATGQRALLLIDAINENNGPDLWPNHLAAFLTLARRYPWIGVVLSVRTTAVPLLIPRHILEADSPRGPFERVFQDTIRDPVLLQVRHTGFANNPVEALRAFFDYYRLPLPAAPLIVYQELANPLLLRLYCQAATHEPGLLARPLPGLTRIVEAVLRDIDSRARVTLQTDPYQEIAKPASQALAAAMRHDGRTYLTRQVAAAAADAAVPVPTAGGYARTPMAVLISEGMLAEDFIAGEPGKYLPVVRFAFERIGDHLAAQTLLDELGYQAGTPVDEGLARLAGSLLPPDAGTPGTAGAYRLQSILEALAVLLPERLSRELPDLITTLRHQPGWQSDIEAAAHQAWLRSLLLRAASAFTVATRQRLADLVTGAPDVAAHPLSDIRRAAIRTALALSVHPDQPLGPGWLRGLLAPMTMSERDRRWTAQIRGTERIRGSDHIGTVYSTLLFWCRTAPGELLMTQAANGETFAQLAGQALMWALPSSDRFLRDSATRAIVALTDVDPAVVTRLLDASAGVDDDYIAERVLAAACAAVLRGGQQSPTIAADLRRFLERHGLPTHVLARDYLVVTVNALAAHRGEDDNLTALSAMVFPPYAAAWPGPLGLPDMTDLIQEHPPFDPDTDLDDLPSNPGEREDRRRTAVSGGYVSITSSLGGMGDFYRYVMHGNHPEGFPFARQRLDEPLNGEPLEYFDPAVLPGWIFARVLQLGWSPQAFGAVDFDIEQEYSRSDAHKRERIGKKYQWLAWHEALARLSGTQRFRDAADPDADRPYESAWQLDFERDIDPTHQLDAPAPDETRHWRALWLTAPLTLDATVAATPGQDGPAATPVVSEPSRAGDWWFPVRHLSQPIPPAGQDPVHALADWATSSADLPDLADYLVIHADLERWVRSGKTGQPTAGGRRYRLLTVRESLLDHPGQSGYPRADILVNIDSVLMRRQDLAALEQWPGAAPLYGVRLDVSATDAIFLGEWPYAAAYLAMCDPAFRPRIWQDAQGSDAIGIGFPAVVVAENYIWEGSLLDCSIPATLSVHLLTSAAAALFPGVWQLDGVARTANGDLLHIDPAPAPGGNSALLIDEAFLAEALAQENLVLVQIIHQSKRVLTGQADNRFAGDVITARFIATVGEETLCDTSRDWIHPARLDE